MKIIRSIHGKTLHDRIRSEDLRQRSEIQDIRWVRQRRKYWNKHVNKMEDQQTCKNRKNKQSCQKTKTAKVFEKQNISVNIICN